MTDNDRKSSRVLYELMFEDMSPSKFLKAAKKAVIKAKQDVGQCRILLMALLNWVDDNPIRFGSETAMGKLTDLILRVDEDDELENDDVLAFIDIIRGFLKTVTVKVRTCVSILVLVYFTFCSHPLWHVTTTTGRTSCPRKSGKARPICRPT